MAISRKQEERLLTEDEWHLVRQSHHPAIQGVSDEDLLKLVKQVRERRDRSQAEAHRQRREIRGKSAPKGVEPTRKDIGTRAKLEILAMSMRRLNGEHARRCKMHGKAQLVSNMRAALAAKQASKTERDETYNSRHALEGMQSIESSRRKSLMRPMERGRLRKAGAVAQATRDSR
ncbi:hypothetical protein J2Z19_004960 [Ensifer adhaerens]|uniref:Uncharacterized protein n=1 Tax=Ensifer adhaerens TaxID=106592 RepID=A0ACC5T2R5_ENSAD|nr:hypothetical protein [Ensifer adhaerens]MBP1875224.1 hypothetical protein [Ensifer adhaerens]